MIPAQMLDRIYTELLRALDGGAAVNVYVVDTKPVAQAWLSIPYDHTPECVDALLEAKPGDVDVLGKLNARVEIWVKEHPDEAAGVG